MARADGPGHDRSMAPKTPDSATPADDTAAPEEQPAVDEQPPPTAQPTPPPLAGARFFGWLRSLDIRREPGWIGGVCAGIASRLGIDPIIVRGIAVVIAILGGPAILLYAAAWLLLPDSTDKIHLEEIFRGRIEPAAAGIAAFFVLAFLPVTQGFWYAGASFWGVPDWGSGIGRVLWTLVLIGLLVGFIIWLARRVNTPTPRDTTSASAAPTAAFVASETDVTTPPTGASEPEVTEWREQQAQVRAEQQAFRNQQASDRAAANRAAAEEARAARAVQREKERAAYALTRSHPLYSLIVIGLALVAGGLAVVTLSSGEPTLLSIVVGLATTLAVLAVGIIINGVRGKRSGGASGMAWIVLVPLVLAGGAAWGNDTSLRWDETVTLSPGNSQSFQLAAGRVELDLTRVGIPDPNVDGEIDLVDLNVGAGQITVIVPEGVNVQFSSTVGAGDIIVGDVAQTNPLSESRVGPVERLSASFGPDEPTRVVVTVNLGAGQIRVIQAGE